MNNRMEMLNMHLINLLQGKNKYEEAGFKEILEKFSRTFGRHIAESSSCSLSPKSNGPQSEIPENSQHQHHLEFVKNANSPHHPRHTEAATQSF